MYIVHAPLWPRFALLSLFLSATVSCFGGRRYCVVGAGQRGKAQKERISCAALCMLAKYLKAERMMAKGRKLFEG